MADTEAGIAVPVASNAAFDFVRGLLAAWTRTEMDVGTTSGLYYSPSFQMQRPSVMLHS